MDPSKLDPLNLLPLELDVSEAIDYLRCLPREKDGTFFWKSTEASKIDPTKRLENYVARMRRIHKGIIEGIPVKERGWSIDDTCHLTKLDQTARASICLSHQSRVLSGTFREADFSPLLPQTLPTFDSKWKCAERTDRLVENSTLAQTVLTKVNYNPQVNRVPHGLILLAGGTKSGKSNVARAIALEAILRNVEARTDKDSRLKVENRLPHLVTFEDPIENWRINDHELLWNSKTPDCMPSLNYGFCFTPRQKGIDVLTLVDAVSDAKRQTPACFYVGEVRAERDWKAVLEFAGSGHLVVATTHASSLTEMLARVFHAMHAVTPSARRIAGGQLLACLHLQTPSLANGSKKVMLPSVWLGSGTTLGALVADGLSSIIPDNRYIWSREQAFMKVKATTAKLSDVNIARELARKIDSEELRKQ